MVHIGPVVHIDPAPSTTTVTYGYMIISYIRYSINLIARGVRYITYDIILLY